MNFLVIRVEQYFNNMLVLATPPWDYYYHYFDYS